MIIVLTEEDLLPAYKEGFHKKGITSFKISSEQVLKANAIVVFLEDKEPYVYKDNRKSSKVLAKIIKPKS